MPRKGVSTVATAGDDAPKLFGRYTVEAVLGRGGVGAVYRARDPVSGERVALKTLELQQPHALAMFEREYQTLASIAHPAVVRTFDYGVADSGIRYYTMELIEGDDLYALMPLPWRALCVHLQTVAEALALLHARGLVHRDVSPRNIRVDRKGQARLLDFGALAQIGAASRMEIRLAESAFTPGLREVAVSGSNERIYLHPETLVTWSDVTLARIVNQGGAQTIVLLVARETAGQRDLSTPGTRDQIMNALKSRKEQLLRTAYLTSMRAKADVTNYLAERLPDDFAPVLVWEPHDRRRPAAWQSVKLDHFEWLRSGPPGENSAAVLTIAGQRHEVVFPSAIEQQMSLRAIADWMIRPRLLKAPGVAA